LTHFQEAANERREDLLKSHQAEIEALKSEHAKKAADLLAQKEAEQSAKRELIESHQTKVESLTSTHATALAEAESRARTREEELQTEIKNLTEAINKSQAQFIVSPLPRDVVIFILPQRLMR